MYVRTSAVAVMVVASLSVIAFAQEAGTKKVQEPEKLSVVYGVDSSGTLLPLERTTAIVKVSAKLTGGAKQVARLDGPRAAVRFPSGKDLVFVVKVGAGVDPSTWVLYAFESKKKNREVVFASSGNFSAKSGMGQVQHDVSKYGEASYQFSPGKELPPGEYGFNPPTSNDIFCFGVDAPK
jgi:hypothetical protein